MPTTYERHPLEILQRPPEAHSQLRLSKQLCDDKEVHLKTELQLCAAKKKNKKQKLRLLTFPATENRLQISISDSLENSLNQKIRSARDEDK